MKTLIPFLLAIFFIGGESFAQFSDQVYGYPNEYLTHVSVSNQGDLVVSGGNLIFIDTTQGMEWSYGYGFGSVVPLNGGNYVGVVNNSALAKFDSIGTVQWSKSYTGTYVRSLMQIPDGDLVGLGQNLTNNGIALNRFNANGNPEIGIEEQANVGYYPLGYDFKRRDDGGYVVVSSIYESSGAISRIMSFDSEFNLSWNKTTTATEDVRFIFIEEFEGSIIVAGSQINGANETDFIIMKLNSAGKIQWSKRFGSHDRDQLYDMEMFDDGSILVAGETALNATGDGTQDCWCEDEIGPDRCPNAFYMLLDLDGDVVWTHTYGGSGCEIAVSLAIDGDDFFLTGQALELGSGYMSTLVKKSLSDYQMCTGQNVQMPETEFSPILGDSAWSFSSIEPSVNQGPIPPLSSAYESEDACPLLSIKNESDEKSVGLEVFPNPASDQITVQLMSEGSEFLVKLYDIDGRLIRSQQVTQDQFTMDVHDLRSGLYILSTFNEQGASKQRRIVIH